MAYAQIFRAGLLGAAALTAGCTISSESGQSIGEQIGITPGTPDEFLIIANEPLVMPDNLNTLPLPKPGAQSPRFRDPDAEARSALFGQNAVPDAQPGAQQPSAGEEALLAAAGASEDNSAVRTQIENDIPPSGDRSYGLTSLFGVPVPAGPDDKANEHIVNSAEENERLQQSGVLTPAAPPDEEEKELILEDQYDVRYR